MSDFYATKALRALAIRTIDAAYRLVSHQPQNVVEASESITRELIKTSDKPEAEIDDAFLEKMRKQGGHIAWLLALDHRYPDGDALSKVAIELAGQALALGVRFEAAQEQIRNLRAENHKFRMFKAETSDAEFDVLTITKSLEKDGDDRLTIVAAHDALKKVSTILKDARIDFDKD